MLWKKVKVKESQRVFVIRRGKIRRVLDAGTYWLWRVWGDLELLSFDLGNLELQGEWAQVIWMKYPFLRERYFTAADVGDKQVAIVSVDGKVWKVLAPGTRALFWKELHQVSVELVDISEHFEIPLDKVATLSNRALNQIHAVVISEGHRGLLYLNGKLVKELEPGSYAFWRERTEVLVDSVDMRLQSMEVSGQEILTQDRVSLRINLEVFFKVEDARKAALEVADGQGYLYKEFQFAIRECIGQRTLDEVLSEKQSLGKLIRERLKGPIETMGMHVFSAGVKDIILPGEMRTLMNKVVEADKQAEANLIRRREEVAATRSLLNTAKLMENNPTLMRLKEMETLERISERVQSLNFVGGPDSLMGGLIKSGSSN